MSANKHISIRPATSADAAALAALRLELEQEDLPQLPPLHQNISAETEARSIKQFNETEGALLLLLFAGDELIGFCDFHPVAIPLRKHCGKLGISIRKEFRNRGLGKQLIRHFLGAIEKNERFRRVELEVLANNPKAIRLYESCGFVLEGTRKGAFFIKGEYVDAYWMCRYFER